MWQIYITNSDKLSLQVKNMIIDTLDILFLDSLPFSEQIGG